MVWKSALIAGMVLPLATVISIDPANGATHAAPSLTAVSSVACKPNGLCVAVGESSAHVAGVATEVGGGRWRSSAIPFEVGSLESVTCPTSRSCVAVGGGGGSALILSSSDGGIHWNATFSSPSLVALNAVTCPSSSVCIAAGIGTGIVKSVNGGSSWTIANSSLKSGTDLAAMACSTPSQCLAIDTPQNDVAGELIETTNGWATSTQLSTGRQLQLIPSISCARTRCFALAIQPNTQNEYAEFGGLVKPWNRMVLPRSTGFLQSVTCWSSRLCVAFGTLRGRNHTFPASAVVVSTSGRSLASAVLPQFAGAPFAGSCSERGYCVAVGPRRNGGVTGAVSRDGGRTWKAQG